jgi:uncharacterized protein (DUF697 family)
MSTTDSLPTLEFIIAIARADGVIQPSEREVIESFAEGVLPAGTTLQALLETPVDVDGILKRVTTAEARERAFEAGYAMAKADGTCSAEEQAILDRAKTAWEIPDAKVSLLDRLVSEARDTVLPSNIKAIDDPAKRAAAIQEDTLKYAVITGVLGAFPLPGVALVTDIAVVGLQVKLIRDIGQYYGHAVGAEAAKSLFASVGVGIGARMALSNVAKLVPGFGSAVGAATAFAATWAIGKMGVAYFENGGKLDAEYLKKVFASAQKEGKDAYADKKADIEARAAANKDAIAELATARKEGKITEAEYEEKLEKLV